MTDAAPDPIVPRLEVAGTPGPDLIVAVVRDHLPPVFDAFLPGQRWYADKGRRIARVAVFDVAAVPAGEGWFALAVLGIDFADGGEPTRYFVPLEVGPGSLSGKSTLAVFPTEDGPTVVGDAFAASAFPTWFLAQITDGTDIPALRGRFRCRSRPGQVERLRAASAGPVRLNTAEQSNTSVRFGDALFLKVFRKLRAGVNPDEELGRYLTTQTSFDRLPRPLGGASYVDADGTDHPLALAQSFVPNVGDGWTATLRDLDALLGATDPASADRALVPIRRLGERTGQLHLALAADSTDPDFAPKSITAADTDRWSRDLRVSLRAIVTQLRMQADSPRSQLRPAALALSTQLPILERRASGFAPLVGTAKIRVHGDYHLGQTLRTADDDWVVLDFEGEPLRSIGERRAKTSPLKDVAGMLRSFAYARGTAARAPAGGEDDMVARRLTEWETAARLAFLGGYRAATGHRQPPLVPADPAAFSAALAAWELDKAVYEVWYELKNRPDWLDLPLSALLAAATPNRKESA